MDFFFAHDVGLPEIVGFDERHVTKAGDERPCDRIAGRRIVWNVRRPGSSIHRYDRQCKTGRDLNLRRSRVTVSASSACGHHMWSDQEDAQPAIAACHGPREPLSARLCDRCHVDIPHEPRVDPRRKLAPEPGSDRGADDCRSRPLHASSQNPNSACSACRNRTTAACPHEVADARPNR